jgi:hypothetical protein
MMSDEPPRSSFGRRLGHLRDIDEVPGCGAGSTARRPTGSQHALRFMLSAFDGDVVGGYTIIVA